MDRCDFYVLHDDDDLEYADIITRRLEQHNFQGHLEDRDDHPGRTLFENLELVIERAKYIFILISNAAVANKWWERKAHISLMARMEHNTDTIIPIHLPDLDATSLPKSLSIFDSITYEEDEDSRFWTKMVQLLGSE